MIDLLLRGFPDFGFKSLFFVLFGHGWCYSSSFAGFEHHLLRHTKPWQIIERVGHFLGVPQKWWCLKAVFGSIGRDHGELVFEGRPHVSLFFVFVCV